MRLTRRFPGISALALSLALWPGFGTARANECPNASDPLPASQLKLLTLNLAHGRKDGSNQMLQRAETTRRNLRDAAAALASIGADVIALQEADAPSRWSGRFDHVRFIAERAGYGCIHHGLHARNTFYEFGTALLSKRPFSATEVHDFEPTPPSTTKGFVIGRLPWGPDGRREAELLTVVSVHLDFSRRSVRRQQFHRLTKELGRFGPPMVVMGDFNTNWDDDSGLLRRFAQDLDLHTWKPGAIDYGTYADGKKRLDWVLISRDLRFADFQVRPETVSDHSAVLAVIEPAAGLADHSQTGEPSQPAFER